MLKKLYCIKRRIKAIILGRIIRIYAKLKYGISPNNNTQDTSGFPIPFKGEDYSDPGC